VCSNFLVSCLFKFALLKSTVAWGDGNGSMKLITAVWVIYVTVIEHIGTFSNEISLISQLLGRSEIKCKSNGEFLWEMSFRRNLKNVSNCLHIYFISLYSFLMNDNYWLVSVLFNQRNCNTFLLMSHCHG